MAAAMTGALAVAVLFQTSPVVRGRVLDGQTGEPVAGAAVVVDGRTADAGGSDGAFAVAAGQAARRHGEHVVLITANGYAFVSRRVDVAGDGVDLGVIRLNRESAGVNERVDVRGAPALDASAARTLTKAELETLSIVLVDDPLRSVHVLPTTAIPIWPALSSGQSSAPAPTFRVFVAYSLNADYAAKPFFIIFNQPVSPFLSVGGGAYGFEASIERGLRGHLGLKASVSRYVDPFRGAASYCQPPFASICAVRVPFRDDTSALYVTAGPVITAREHKRTSLFAHALVGAVRSSSTFSLSGNNLEYVVNPTSLPSWLIVVTGQPFGQPNSVSYGDHLSDVGLAAAVGGGIDRKLAHRLQFRASVDWNPTFLSRPNLSTNTAVAVVPSERGMQSHTRLSLGVVWQVGR